MLQPESVADRLYVRRGDAEREVDGSVFTCQLRGIGITVSESIAGVLVDLPRQGIVVATSGGRFEVTGPVSAEAGRFEGDEWIGEAELPVRRTASGVELEIHGPSVVLLRALD